MLMMILACVQDRPIASEPMSESIIKVYLARGYTQTNANTHSSHEFGQVMKLSRALFTYINYIELNTTAKWTGVKQKNNVLVM